MVLGSGHLRSRLKGCLLLLLVAAAGCGGLDQNDIRKYAIKRPSDEELDNAAPRPAPAIPATLATTATDTANAARPPSVTPAVPNPATGVSSPATPSDSTPAPPTSSDAPPTSAPAAAVFDTRSPDPSLGLAQRRQITIDNLTRIGQALEAY
jgi:hypothetical protein